MQSTILLSTVLRDGGCMLASTGGAGHEGVGVVVLLLPTLGGNEVLNGTCQAILVEVVVQVVAVRKS